MKRSRALRAFKAAAVLVIVAPAGLVSDHAMAGEKHGAKTAIRSTSRHHFGRLVLHTSGKTTYEIDQDGDHVMVRLNTDAPLGSPPTPPRNVVAINTNGATLDLVLSHGARLRQSRINGHVVLDILDSVVPPLQEQPETLATTTPKVPALKSAEAAPIPRNPPPLLPAHQDGAVPVPHDPSPPQKNPEVEAASTSPTAAVPALAPADTVEPPPTAERVPVAMQPLPPPPVTSATAPAPAATTPPSPSQTAAPPAVPALGSDTVETIQQAPPGRDVLPENEGPVGLRARRTRLPKELDGTAFIVAFDNTTGAAAFDEEGSTYVVFDERRPLDLATLLNDPVFGSASVKLLPNGTLIQVPHPNTLSIALTQLAQGWRIAALKTAPKQQPIAVSYVDGHLNLAAEQSADVVNMADPVTGATLLVGTQRHPGQGVAFRRVSTEFILRPSSQGVVVEPLSDAITLKQVAAGFVLSGAPPGLALSPATTVTPALMDAAHLTRRLNLSAMPPNALLRLAVKQLGDASRTPPLARGPRRHAAAESFLALGLATEAESLLHVASEQDPKEAASADTTALTAIAALLAGRVDEARGLMDPRLDGTDEITLWRAVLQATQDEGSPSAAAAFAVTAPLVFEYPPAIREHILPLIIETMIEGGQIPAAQRLLDQRPDDLKLAYARALLQQANGDTVKALSTLDAMANGHDQSDQARAAIRAVELRLSTKEINKTQAADALEKLLYAWRGDSRDLAVRQRVAELRSETGGWRGALAGLRQAAVDFPEQAASIRTRMKSMFAAMIRDKSQDALSPLEFVSTVDENTDLVPDVGDDEVVEQSLADRLIALDLPSRAKPVLEKLMRQAKSPVAKARFGASLATLESREGDDAGALAVLDASKDPELPPDLAEQRTILQAEAVARQGNPTAAAAMLLPLASARSIEARAGILQAADKWPDAEQAWSSYADLTLPPGGMLGAVPTRTLIRLATAATRAHDDAGIARLRAKFDARLEAGPLADIFHLLTAEPVKTIADIKRSQQETGLAEALPTDLKALQATMEKPTGRPPP